MYCKSPFNVSFFLSEPSRENLPSGFSTRSDTNWAMQPQKMARGLKFWIKEVEGLYYLCSENKVATFFSHMQKQVSHDIAHIKLIL